MKTAIILYGSQFPAGDRQPINVGGAMEPYYVRSQVIEADGLATALDRAKPRADEMVLNTVWAPPKTIERTGAMIVKPRESDWWRQPGSPWMDKE